MIVVLLACSGRKAILYTEEQTLAMSSSEVEMKGGHPPAGGYFPLILLHRTLDGFSVYATCQRGAAHMLLVVTSAFSH